MIPPEPLQLIKPNLANGVDEKTADNSTPSGVSLSEAATTISTNYTTANVISERLRQLQAWVRKQQLIYNANE